MGEPLMRDVKTPRSHVPSILIVCNKMAIGGAERHLSRVLPALKMKGLEVDLFLFERGGEFESAVLRSGVPVHGKSYKSSFVHLIASAVTLYRHIRKKRPDIVHFFLPKSYIIGSLVAMLAGHKVCFMSRRSLAHYHRNHPWLACLERMIHHRMSALLGNSHAVVNELISEAGSQQKVGLIYNGTDVPSLRGEPYRARKRAEIGCPPDAFIMVIVANLIYYKGHADLLDALYLAVPALPQSWRLLAIGRDDGIGSKLKERASSLGLSPNVIWMGERSDVETILPAADVALLVSHQEGFSNALIEAMGQGLPVIATAVGGNLDAVEDGICGRLVPVADPASLSEAILELASKPKARAAMGVAARERVMMMFSHTNCVDRYERLYVDFPTRKQEAISTILEGESFTPRD
jgi:glycosyltransferase involved in cell wall biosynthesis